MILTNCGQFIYQTISIIIELFATVIIFISTYSIAKILQNDGEEIKFLLIFILVLSLLINAGIFIDEIFVKHHKLIRTSIAVDLFVIVSCSFVVITSQIEDLTSNLLINQLEQLRSIPNTFKMYKFILNAFEKSISCCRVPSLVSL